MTLEFIRQLIRHHNISDLKSSFFYEMLECVIESNEDNDKVNPQKTKKLWNSYEKGKISDKINRMYGKAFCKDLKNSIKKCNTIKESEKKLLELIIEGMNFIGNNVPSIMGYEYDWLNESEPDFMPISMSSQIMLVYSVNDIIYEYMMDSFNAEARETYNMTPITTVYLTPDTEDIFKKDDFPERFEKWLDSFLEHIINYI